MEKKNDTVDFFMGANSPDGFYSLYDEYKIPRQNHRSFLIKGGAGTGKSGIIKRVASAFADRDELVERIHCSSDPNSLDGVVLHTAKCNMFDATPPHVIEPAYPGSYETVINLCEYFDEDKMEERLEKTVFYQTENNEYHKKCRRFIRCASILLEDNKSFAEGLTDFEKVNTTALKLCNYLFKKPCATLEGKTGKVQKRMLSAITNQGFCCYENTASTLCKKLICIEDEHGAASGAFLKVVADYVQKAGYTVFCCYCPLDPTGNPEHIFIPEADIGFVTKNRYHAFNNIAMQKTIHCTRFTNMEELKKRKQYLKFNQRAADTLLESAISVLKEAKSTHDELEKQYTDAVNFTSVDKKFDEVIVAISKRYSK